MKYQIELTRQAIADLTDLYRYIAFDLFSPQVAEEQISRIERAIASLEQMPERFRAYGNEKWKKRNLRIMPVNRYLVFYIPSETKRTVTVIRVLYGGRDIEPQIEGLL